MLPSVYTIQSLDRIPMVKQTHTHTCRGIIFRSNLTIIVFRSRLTKISFLHTVWTTTLDWAKPRHSLPDSVPLRVLFLSRCVCIYIHTHWCVPRSRGRGITGQKGGGILSSKKTLWQLCSHRLLLLHSPRTDFDSPVRYTCRQAETCWCPMLPSNSFVHFQIIHHRTCCQRIIRSFRTSNKKETTKYFFKWPGFKQIKWRPIRPTSFHQNETSPTSSVTHRYNFSFPV